MLLNDLWININRAAQYAIHLVAAIVEIGQVELDGKSHFNRIGKMRLPAMFNEFIRELNYGF